MLHHISLALGFRRVFEDATAIGYGLIDGEDLLCLKLRPGAEPPGAGFHLAFAASSREAVHAFHESALRIAGSDNGAPGLRPHYGANYYASFLTDPDGHRIEAVFIHKGEVLNHA